MSNAPPTTAPDDVPASFRSRLRGLSTLAAGAATAIGLLALIGWILGADHLRALIPGEASMKANAALGIAGLGGSALLLGERPAVSLRRIAGVSLAIIAAGLGLVTFLEYAAGLSLGIDELLFADPGAIATSHPGRMAATTALALVLAASALLALDRAPRLSALLAAAVALFGVLALTGYAVSVDAYRDISGTTRIALPTALALVLLGVAIISMRPGGPIVRALADRGASGHLLRRLLPFAIAAPIILGALRVRAQDYGLFDTKTGILVMVISFVALISAAVVASARRIGRSDAAREQALRDLKRSESRALSVIEGAGDAYVATDESGAIRGWNKRAQAMFGWTAWEVLGRSLEETLIPERHREAHRADIERFLETGERRALDRSIEIEAMRRDGSELPVELTTSAISSEGGWEFQAFIRDISQRRREERARLEAEERFRRAFEDSGAGMAMVSVGLKDAGRILEANDALCELTGYPRDQLRGIDVAEICHPDDLAASAEGLRSMLAGEIASYQAEQRIITAAGAVSWVALSTSVVRDADGEPIHRVLQLLDISERKRYEGRLQHLADHDPLTGLFNRRRFELELERELESAWRYKTGGALLVLDLDNFKYVNDSLGHVGGDELIASVSRALTKRLRSSDTIGRLGGDEFGVILPHAGEEDAELMAGGILEVIRDNCSVDAERGPRRTTASIGVAMLADGESKPAADELLVEADIAMYDAKEAGRDRISMFRPGSDRREKMEARLTWAERIRTALAEDRFVLHAQAIAPLRPDGGPERHELLLRMVGETGEEIPPGTFLFVAERFGMIEEIDRWVVREAIRMLAALERSGRDVCLAVNLSAKSINDPRMTAFIAGRLAATGADPRRLIFEVTETAAIENIDRAKRFAQELRDLGCSFALDDFGSGFASFYYLKHLEFDYLKIDGEFVKGMVDSKTDQLVVRSLVDIARGLGKKTIAEFVGDEATMDLLRSLGVDYAQGFHIGRPAPLAHVEPGPREWGADGLDDDRSAVPADQVPSSAGTG